MIYVALTIVFGLAVIVFGMLQAFKIGYRAGKGEELGDQFKDFKNIELIDLNETDDKAQPIEKLMEEDNGEEED